MSELKILNRLSVFSLAFGGFLIIAYLGFIYFAVWRSELVPILPGFQRTRGPSLNPLSLVLSPYSLLWLSCGIAFLANGLLLSHHVKSQEHRKTRFEAVQDFLTSEEKSVVNALQKSNGGITQKQLSLELGFSAVKVHRVLLRLEHKNLVESRPFGMTKKIVLKEPVSAVV